jgi:hypothetical protein
MLPPGYGVNPAPRPLTAGLLPVSLSGTAPCCEPRLGRQARRAGGVPLMIVKKVLTAPSPDAALVTIGECSLALSNR